VIRLNVSLLIACFFVCVDDALMYALRERFETLLRKRRGYKP